MAGSLIPRHRTLLPDLFDWLDGGFGLPPMFRNGADLHSIPIEITEQDTALLVRAELPGMDPERDIEVTVSDDVLAIRAQHVETRQDKEKHSSEFRYGSFQRVLRLPGPIPQEGVEAGYDQGILTLRIPKPPTAKQAVRTVKVAGAAKPSAKAVKE
jgi:HSP20 family molecular chaperone IbpA